MPLSQGAAQLGVDRRQANAERLVASQRVSEKHTLQWWNFAVNDKSSSSEWPMRRTMELPEVHYVLGFPNPTKLQDRLPPVFLPNQSCLYRQCCDPDFLFCCFWVWQWCVLQIANWEWNATSRVIWKFFTEVWTLYPILPALSLKSSS